MPTTPVISVIVPVYKAERYLNECIDSILAQTFSDFELILVDDGSPDRSGEICDQYAAKDSRIRVIHKPNGGVSSARNSGINAAKGEWIAFVDADDMIAPDMLEKLLDKAEQENADIVTCDLKFLYPDNITKTEHTYYWQNNSEKSLAEYMMTTWTIVCACLYKKKLFIQNNLYFPKDIIWGEDFNVAVKLMFFSSKTTSIPKPLYIYRQHSNSICHNLSMNALNSILNSYVDIAKFLEYNNGDRPLISKALSHRVLWHGHTLALNKDTFHLFREIYPKKKRHIFTCRKINFKVKIITWCLTHNLQFVASFIVSLRNLLGR